MTGKSKNSQANEKELEDVNLLRILQQGKATGH